EHLRQAQELGVSFSQYCRERDLRFHQWYWIKRVLMRKGVIAGQPKVEKDRPVGFVPVRIAPAAAGPACRISHASGWVIECGILPQTQWLSALMSGVST
ncbi:MAG: IS66 family insertion sequence element accessory protein TnpA, partial [Burkholderiales bacterium]